LAAFDRYRSASLPDADPQPVHSMSAMPVHSAGSMRLADVDLLMLLREE
jgi:hypothetical protein